MAESKISDGAFWIKFWNLKTKNVFNNFSQMAAFTAEVEIVTAARYETPSRFWDQQ